MNMGAVVSVMSVLGPLAGGALIGLGATAFLLGNGRIAGVGGVVGGLFTDDGGQAIRAWFLAGLVLAGAVAQLAHPSSLGTFVALPVVAVAGVLVGFGAQRGSGCTSGHGVCGLARLSARSIAATCTFMATGVATVFVTAHVLGGAR